MRKGFIMNENRDRSQWQRINKHRPEQADILRWQLALSHIAAQWGEGKYKSMKPIPFKDPESDRLIYLNSDHFAVWATLLNMGYDLRHDYTNVLHSYGEIAHHSGLAQSKVEAALDVLENCVRIIATNRRGNKQTNETWLFTTPLADGETWRMRTGKKSSGETKNAVSAQDAVSTQEVQEVGQAFYDAFGKTLAFQDQKTADAFARGIPRLIEQAGSAERLKNLFQLIESDTSREGMTIKASMQKVTSPVEYLRKPLPDWFRRYEPYSEANEQPDDSDDMGQPFEEEYEQNPFFVPPAVKVAALPPPPQPVAVVPKPSPQPVTTEPPPQPPKVVAPPPKPPPPPVVEARPPIPIREQTVQVSEFQVANTLRSLNYCFDDPPCLASEQHFGLRLPQMAALTGRDPERVRALFVAMNDDQSDRLAAEAQAPLPNPVVRWGELLANVEKAEDAYRILLERIPGWHTQYKDKVNAYTIRWAENAKARMEKAKAKAS
jgi:hypothetical protein